MPLKVFARMGGWKVRQLQEAAWMHSRLLQEPWRVHLWGSLDRLPLQRASVQVRLWLILWQWFFMPLKNPLSIFAAHLAPKAENALSWWVKNVGSLSTDPVRKRPFDPAALLPPFLWPTGAWRRQPQPMQLYGWLHGSLVRDLRPKQSVPQWRCNLQQQRAKHLQLHHVSAKGHSPSLHLIVTKYWKTCDKTWNLWLNYVALWSFQQYKYTTSPFKLLYKAW